MPSDHRGITFGSWLDIFLEFALGLARHGRMKESYEICEAAKDCALYYTNREDMFLIHICWLSKSNFLLQQITTNKLSACALLLCDEETCVNVARFFMKDYQFTTDSYRMFTAVTRMVHSPVSWYSSGPSQKYILRQIKAMDYALVDDECQNKYFAEKGSYSAVDEKGQLIINDDLDIALLIMYGHILHTGGSYFLALSRLSESH
jgi:general transcription factor 3C polypeptide 3 (transcription factor C subunit 4)